MTLACNKKSQFGFTLVELMITIFIASLLTVAFYSTYILQRKSYVAQGQVVEMQQNIRAGIEMMTRDMRMAGYDPVGTAFVGIGVPKRITNARQDLLAFAADLDENGAIGGAVESEYFAFDLYTAGGISSLGRASSPAAIVVTSPSAGHYEATGHQAVADNIERLEFAYVLNDGTVTNDATAKLDDIRNVRISILARSRDQDSKYVNTSTYTTAAGTVWDPVDDGFRRRLIITQVDLRNMGL